MEFDCVVFNVSEDFKAPPSKVGEDVVRNVIAIVAYAIIFFISLFGNIMVCQIIVCNRKLHTFTNFFIANLSVSDLLMTIINVPFGVAPKLLDDWPFGNLLCKCLPFIQALSVYVSTITMCIISIDRYCVVVHPLGPRITNVMPLGLVLVIIWFISCVLSVPFAFNNEVTSILFCTPSYKIFHTMVRCSGHTSVDYEKGLTIFAFLTQYLVPLAIASIAYSSIAFHIKKRSRLGAMTREQINRILKTNRQTITMLVLVLIVFAVTWLPFHLFYLSQDFFNAKYNIEAFLFVHWLAMSSICYNSFIYSARNRHFRNGMKNFFRYLVFKRRDSGSGSISGAFTLEHSTGPTQLTTVPSLTRIKSQLCRFNRNHTCTRSCLQRADDGTRSSTSSPQEENTLAPTRNASQGSQSNGMQTGNATTAAAPANPLQTVVNGKSSKKLSLPILGSSSRAQTNGRVAHRPADDNSSAQVGNCEIAKLSLLSGSVAPTTPQSATLKRCNSIATELIPVSIDRPEHPTTHSINEESNV